MTSWWHGVEAQLSAPATAVDVVLAVLALLLALMAVGAAVEANAKAYTDKKLREFKEKR